MDVKVLSIDDYFESEINDDIEKIHKAGSLLFKFNHYVDARQPGSGKTTRMLEVLNLTEGSHLVIAASHEFLENEVKNKFNKPFVVLKGFEKCCHKIDDPDYGSTIKQMRAKKIFPKYICTIMNCPGRCYYREQFDKIKEENISIGAVQQFLHILDFYEHGFNSIWVEENALSGNFSVTWIPKKLKTELRKLVNNGIEQKKLKILIKAVDERDFNTFMKYSDLLKEVVDKYNSKIVKSYENKKIDKHFFSDFCYLRVDELLMYIYFEKRYETDYINYQQFLFWKQMEEKNIPINYNCAAFMKNEFLWNLKSFQETFSNYTGEVEIITSNEKNKKSKIIKINNSGYYREHVENQLKRSKDKIIKFIRNEKYNKKHKVVILTYKFLVEKNNGQLFGCPAIWFGGKHGMNTFRNYDTMIVFGTFLTSPKAYEEYFEEHHPDEDIPNFSETITEDGVKIPADERLQIYYKERYEQDVYDSIHRLRPLTRDVTIYFFGNNIPEKLKDELSYFEKDL